LRRHALSVYNTHAMDLVLLGAPGSGKGTQAELLHAALGLGHVASGDLFRHHLDRGTPLGLQARQYISRGALVPDAVTVDMVRGRLAEAEPDSGVLLDGFPRTLPQAAALDRILEDLGRRLSAVIHLELDDEHIVERLAGRLVCRECDAPFHVTANPFRHCPYGKCRGEHLFRREDDRADTVRTRLATYHRETAPLIEHYRSRHLLVTVIGAGSVQDVAAATAAAIHALSDPR
jgi:adenylate kinase